MFPPPRIARQVSSASDGDTLQIVLLGDEVSFDCSVESVDVTEVSIWWQKDGVNLTSGETEKYSSEVSKTSEGVVSSELVVSDIGWDDEGGYSCRARDGNEGRIEKNKATIAVQGNDTHYLIKVQSTSCCKESTVGFAKLCFVEEDCIMGK